MLVNQTKRALATIGRCVPPSAIRQMNAVINYLAVGRWMAENRMKPRYKTARPEQVFDRIAAEVGNQKVLYLEFGVFEGRTIRYWSKLLRNPESHLHGFDSFEGLPESWTGPGYDHGFFSTHGQLPEVDDPRVKFFKGWFEQTLPIYEAPAHDVLIVNLDADLYSSTAFVLEHIRPFVRTGDFLYFDEFNHRDHELRAFDEFRKASGISFYAFATTATLEHIAFRTL